MIETKAIVIVAVPNVDSVKWIRLFLFWNEEIARKRKWN